MGAGEGDPVGRDQVVYERLVVILCRGVVAGIIPVLVGLLFFSLAGRTEAVAFPGLAAVARGLAGLDPTSFIFLGMLILLALPPLQALVALLSYLGQRNRRFAAAALGVLVVQAVAVLVAWVR